MLTHVYIAHSWHDEPVSTPRQRARERTESEIRALAWRHLEAHGAAALSLRAIARDLGVVSSAIYRYVASRDDLLTMLIEEGYADLADAVEAAERAVPRDRFRDRWLAVSRETRAWAVRRPAAWGLLYGAPVPGYEAPAERTTPHGIRVVALLAAIVLEAAAAEALSPVVGPAAGRGGIPSSLEPALSAGAAEVGAAPGGDAPAALVALTITGWTSVLGAVSSEVFGQLGRDSFDEPDALADVTFATLADAMGL